MKTLLKFLLILFLWLLLGAGLAGAALLLGRPWTEGVLAALALLLGWLAFLLIRRLIVRYRARRQVEQLVNVERRASRLSLPKLVRWPSTYPVERRLMGLIRLLKGSRLSEQGDPLYVLPWYLVVGETASGKSSLLGGSRLPSPALDDEKSLRNDPASAGWWLTNDAVFVDAPGAYMAETGERHREWHPLLAAMERLRPREPLNGVVVAIAADSLGGDVDALYESGRRLRKRVDEAMRSLKLRLPVYLVVTRCDTVPGFRQWCGALPREALDQPMGHANDGQATVDEFLDGALATIGERIKTLLVPLLNQGAVSPDLLELPSALARLRPGLGAVAEGLFQNNVYEESPVVRGIYFTGVAGEHGEPPVQAFARDLLQAVIPAEREVRSTLNSAEKAERLVRRTVLSAWGVSVLLAASVLTSTYLHHQAWFNEVAEQHAGTYVKTARLVDDIEQNYRLRELIREVEQETGSWWMPWFMFAGEDRPAFLDKLRALYVSRLRHDVLAPVLAHFDNQANRLFHARGASRRGVATPDAAAHEVALYIGTIARRIALIDAVAGGDDEEALMAMPGPFEATDLLFSEDVAPVTAQQLNVLYVQGLLWSEDRDALVAERDRLRLQLVSLLQLTGRNLSWVTPWANSAVRQAEVRLSDFWSGSSMIENDLSVAPAYTLAGKEAIDNFFFELQTAGLDAATFGELKAAFDKSYQKDYLRAWEHFALNFDQGLRVLGGHEDWVTAVDDLATPRNPYFRLFDQMAEQLEPFQTMEEPPEWLQLVYYYQEMRSFAPANQVNDASKGVFTKLGLKLLGKAGAAGKAAAGAGKSALKTQRQLDKANKGKGPDERAQVLEQAGSELGVYHAAMTEVVANSNIRSVSVNAAAALFANPDNPAAGDSAVAKAYQSINKLQSLIGKSTNYNKAFWRLYGGPMHLIEQYLIGETACQLQSRWEDKFLSEVEGVSPYKKASLMFGEGGKLWSMMDGDLKPFVARRFNAGYVPVKLAGRSVPFNEEFLDFATKGWELYQRKPDGYGVTIESLPTLSNREAQYRPNKTAVVLQCPEAEQVVVNHNFPVTQRIKWNEQCGRVVLAIGIGEYTVEKVWGSPLAFAEFLKTFRLGRQRLVPADFPADEAILTELGITHLDVEFRFKGHEPVVELLDRLQPEPPRQLANCWD